MKAVILNPHFWLYILLWSLFVGGVSYWGGYDSASESARLEEQGRTVDAIQKVIDENAKVLADERALREQDRKRFTTYREETAREKVTTDRVIAGLRSGAVRLRVPVRAVCPAAPDGSGQTAAGISGEGYAELSADGSEFLVGQLARGDKAIRKHAAVVDLYENLRQKCSAPSTQPEQKP